MSEKDANVGSISFIGIFAYLYSSVNRFEAFAFVVEILSYTWTIICGTKLVVDAVLCSHARSFGTMFVVPVCVWILYVDFSSIRGELVILLLRFVNICTF